MQTVPLGATGRTTTQLGFGCSSIMGVLKRRQSLALLESAFEAGIRHFDTAPMYGYGEAESCLGEFLNRHRGEITMTTKFGIPPAESGVLKRAGRAIARPLLQRFPAVKKQLRRRPQLDRGVETKAAHIANPIFNAERARASLEKSLAALRTDRIDLWQLHDVKVIDLAADSRGDALLRMLEDAVREGKVGLFGVGSDRGEIPEFVERRPEYCAVVQYEWSVLNEPPPSDWRLRVHHRALSKNFRALAETLSAASDICKRWSEEVGADLARPDVLAHLMLKAACVLNPEGIVFFLPSCPRIFGRMWRSQRMRRSRGRRGGFTNLYSRSGRIPMRIEAVCRMFEGMPRVHLEVWQTLPSSCRNQPSVVFEWNARATQSGRGSAW